MEPEARITRSQPMRVVYGALGFVFLGIGIAGWFVPGLPGTVNLLAALYFFSLSSERMHRWMLSNRLFGQTLRDYKAGYGIPRGIKIVAVTAIVASVAFGAGWAIESLWLRIGLVSLGVYGVWFIVTRPTTEVVRSRDAARHDPDRASDEAVVSAKKPR